MTDPPIPSVPDTQRATGTYPLRFEDLCQDGRVHFEPVVASIDAAIWRPLLRQNSLVRTLHADGVRPIFTRLVLEVGSARLELGTTVTAEGVYELSHEPDGQGGARRLFLNMWTSIWAGPDKRRAERVSVGRLFAEHQLTRPLAPAGERRVTTLPGLPIPRAEYHPVPPDTLLDLWPGAEWLEPESRVDAAPIAFGLSHTDINQHVNSLVYPRLFADAALRRFASLGADTKTLAARLHISFRKPFFAGSAAEISLRAFREGDEVGAVGTFRASRVASSSPQEKPHVAVQLGFSRSSPR
jgi:hypothetical protein